MVGAFAHRFTFALPHKQHHLTLVGHPEERFFLVLNVWIQRPELYSLAPLKYDSLAGFIEDLGRSEGEVPKADVRHLTPADRYCDSRPMAVLQTTENGKSVRFTDERWVDYDEKKFNGCGLFLPDLTRLNLGADLNILLQQVPGDDKGK